MNIRVSGWVVAASLLLCLILLATLGTIKWQEEDFPHKPWEETRTGTFF